MMQCFKGKITPSKLFFSAEATRKKAAEFQATKNAILGQSCRPLIARRISLEIGVYVR